MTVDEFSDDEEEVEPVAPFLEIDDEVEPFDSLGEARVEDKLPRSAYELFCSKNKCEIESELPLDNLIKQVKRTWSSEHTVSTAASTEASPFSDWHCYAIDDMKKKNSLSWPFQHPSDSDSEVFQPPSL
jgi:hypothetical protein